MDPVGTCPAVMSKRSLKFPINSTLFRLKRFQTVTTNTNSRFCSRSGYLQVLFTSKHTQTTGDLKRMLKLSTHLRSAWDYYLTSVQ